jgi:membrane associated rhomboid family serine protease
MVMTDPARESPPQVLRVTADRRQADDWALVLTAIGIEARIEWSLRGYAVIVGGANAAAAAAHLDAYDAENRPAPAPAPARDYGPTRAAVICAVVLAAFFVVTGPRADGAFWFDRGAADARRIVEGEWWRTVTALTLHADFPHILANAVTLIIFGSALCTVLGPGVALSLLLLAGAGGNLMTAVLRASHHSSVGASTAIFAAVGALAAIQIVRRRQRASRPSWRAWAPLAAGLALLAFLGSAAQSDVLAHFFGFAAGAGLGAAIVIAHPTPAAPRTQLSLVAGVLLVTLGCWFAAIAAR